MGYWDNLIDIYESWDHDSLVEEAYQLSCDIRDDIRSRFNVDNPLYAALMIGAYFMDADRFADGDEVTLFRNLFEDRPLDLGGDVLLRSYQRQGWQPWVENYLRTTSGRAFEAAMRFGIVVCAADGFIRPEERQRILRWV